MQQTKNKRKKYKNKKGKQWNAFIYKRGKALIISIKIKRENQDNGRMIRNKIINFERK